MAVVYLDIYAAATPNGTALTTLTDADVSGFEMRMGENELGSGSFTIRRDHPSATEANLATGNYVKVRIPLIQVAPVFGFWLDEHKDTIVAQNEEGGEDLMRGGPGTLFIYAHAALLNQFYNGSLGGLYRGNFDVPGYWTWTTEPYGAIMVRLTEEGQLEPGTPLQNVTIDWTRTLDSAGNAWPTVNQEIQFPIGTDGLTVMSALVQSGELFLRADADLAVHGYQTRGTDRTSGSYATNKVRFVKGENILTELTREGHGTRAATHAIVVGKDMTYRQVVSPSYVSGTGRWITVDYSESNDTALLDKVGLRELRQRADDIQGLELEFEAGDDQVTGRYLPFKHFKTGDLVTLNTGTAAWDYANASYRVTGFRIVLREASRDATDAEKAASFRWVVELGSGSQGVGTGVMSGGGKCCPSLNLCHDVAANCTVMGRDYVTNTYTVPVTNTTSGFRPPLSAYGNTGNDLFYGGPEGLVVYTGSVGGGPRSRPEPDASWPNHLVGGWAFAVHGAASGLPAGYADGGWSVTNPKVQIMAVGPGTMTVWLEQVSGFTAAGTAKLYKVVITSQNNPVGDVTTLVSTTAVTFPGTVINVPNDGACFHYVTIDDTGTAGASLNYGGWNWVSASPSSINGGPGAMTGDGTTAAPCSHKHDYVAAGGTTGQVLAKSSATDWATQWVTPTTGAPTTADYLVGTAQAGLSAEIVVGTTPGGELGGTWAAPTVDAVHSGSTHSAATDTHIADTVDAHDASAISFVPTGTIAATDVQAAIAEVATEATGSRTFAFFGG